ncbi:MAG: methyltransferase domain-containing protein [Candidatus Blackburnbacteria bacterium]|nr:methyltransferase domain-containing protein [Candidatus Blackburnbacteria bacterium]
MAMPNLGNTVANLYTDQRDKYTAFANESFSWRFIERPSFDKHLLPIFGPNTRVVDAGCGVGRTLNYLLESGVQAKNIIGVDINPDMIKVSKQKAPNVRLEQMNIEELPLPERSADLIICTHVLHYLDSEQFFCALSSFYRVLDQGGILFWIITHPVRTKRKNLEKYFDREWIMDHTPWGTKSPLYFRPVCDLVNLTLNAGFELLSLDEPEIDLRGQEADPNEYEKYSACPSRLAIQAVKRT